MIGGKVKNLQNVVAVLPVRFQTEDLAPDVHPGHWDMVAEVCGKHQHVHFVLGVPRSYPTDNDPLPYEARMHMIREAIMNAFPCVTVTFEQSLSRDISYEERSREFDASIMRQFPNREILVYGASDSFIDKYSGAFKVQRVATTTKMRGTEIRKRMQFRHTRDFRAGFMYAIVHRHRIAYPSVDVVVLNKNTGTALLVKKKTESGWRFPGSFFNIETDTDFESAAARTIEKELPGIVTQKAFPVASVRMMDWRYKRSRDGILTMLMRANYSSGIPQIGIGVDDVQWFAVADGTAELLVRDHHPLGKIMQTRWWH